MVLLVSIPFSMSQEWATVIGEEDFLEGEFAEFAVSVKNYEPTVLTTSTIEKTNAPVFAHLWAIPSIPGAEMPRIQRVTIRETGTTVMKSYNYFPPTYYTWNDFGYLVVVFRRIEKEEDVPKEIVGNFTMRIDYKSDVVPGLLAGGVVKTLSETERKDITIKRTRDGIEIEEPDLKIIQTSEHAFFAGRGYIVAERVIDGKNECEGKADFILFDSRGNSRSISVKECEERGPFSLVPGSKELIDMVRIRVDGIEDKKVTITLLAGSKIGHTETGFKLHVPIEKRPEFLDLTPEEIVEQINKTDELIKDLDKFLDGLNNVVEFYHTACAAVTVGMIVGSFIGLVPGPVEGVGEGVKEAVTGIAAREAGRRTVNEIQVYSSKGENAFLIDPVPVEKLDPLVFKKLIEELNKPKYNKPNLYAVYTEGGKLEEANLKFYIMKGDKADFERDEFFTHYNAGEKQYKDFKLNFAREIQNAQRAGIDATLFGEKYELKAGNKDLLGKTEVECEDIMSRSACLIWWNACDPVICPPSRCDLGGKHEVSNVQQSGLIGSLILCAPNIMPPPPGERGRGPVFLPICLTGIEASAKYIKTHLEGYKICLNDKLKEGKSTGVCDRMRSIFICRFVWKEAIRMLGLIGSGASKSTGPVSEYQKSVKQSKDVVHYFAEGYAAEIFAAYKGKVTDEIGVKICESVAITGRVPTLGEFAAELARGGNPVQGTVWFEEQPYATTAGASSYFVYYHIYAGSSEQPVNYQIYLRGGGADSRELPIASGMINAGDFVDKTAEKVGPSGYQDICMVLNGETRCGFGKMVSTSMAIQELSEGIAVRAAAKKIDLERDCVPDYSGILGASVNRKCSRFEPSGNWINVGSCLKPGEKEKTEIGCWAELSTGDIDAKLKAKCISLGGNDVCTKDEKCEGDEKAGFDEKEKICCKGKCVKKETLTGVPSPDPTVALSPAKEVEVEKPKMEITSINFLIDGQRVKSAEIGDKVTFMVEHNCHRVHLDIGMDVYHDIRKDVGYVFSDMLKKEETFVSPKVEVKPDVNNYYGIDAKCYDEDQNEVSEKTAILEIVK